MLIGLQLYSVRDALSANFEETLKKVSEMGYDGVEFAGLFGHSPEEVKALCAKYNLTPISAHVSLKEMNENPDTFKDYAAIGCKYIAIPYLPAEDRADGDNFNSLFSRITEVCKKAKENGLVMLYHNHDFEFVKLEDGTYFLDKLYEEIPSDLLETEIDTCWVNVAGEDPSEYVKKYTGRAHVVHLKDFYKQGHKVEGMYELIGITPTEDAANAESFGFRPIGHGMQNVPKIIEAAESAGAQWLIVEQDRPTPGKDPINEVTLSREYLKSINY